MSILLAPATTPASDRRAATAPSSAARWLRPLGRNALTLVGMLALAWLGREAMPGFAGLVSLSAGFAIGMAIVHGTIVLPAIALAGLIESLLWAAGSGDVTVGALAQVLEAWVARALLARRIGLAAPLARTSDAVAFLVAAPLLATVAGLFARFGLSLFVTHRLVWPDDGFALPLHWLAHVTGALIVAPSVLAWSNVTRPSTTAARTGGIEPAALIVAGFALSIAAFTPLSRAQTTWAAAFLVLAITLIAALRLRARVALPLSAGVVAIAGWGTAQGVGVFVGGTFEQNAIAFYAFAIVLAGLALMLAAVAGERARAARLSNTSIGEFRRLVEQMNDGLVVRDASGVVTAVSERLCRMLGLSRAALLGTRLEALRHGESLGDAVRDGDELSTEWALRRADGGTLIARLVERPLFDDAGVRIGTFTVISDITGRRQAEEQARQHLQQLAHVARVSSMGEMASAIAHEINQPLTAIASYSQACIRLLQAERAVAPDVLEAMTKVADEAKRAGEVVKQVRNFVRAKSGEVAPVDPNVLVTEVLRLALPEARQHNIALATRLASQLPAVLVERIQMEQVLLNLLRNAIDAIRDTRGRARLVTLRTRTHPGGIAIDVEDTGPGLPAEATERIFEPFYTTKPDGLGIGLAISRSIVAAHGGALCAAANEAGGATFTVQLPTGGLDD
jgi:PAS domain S-box-containing protein